MRTLSCPLCGIVPVQPILEEIPVRAEVENKQTSVGGLKAFQCRTEGHIFFIRAADLEAPAPVAIETRRAQSARGSR